MIDLRPRLVEGPELKSVVGKEVRSLPTTSNYLIVKPSQPLSPAPASTKALGILSRQEIARRRDGNERARRAAMAQPASPVTMAASIEMDAADVTPLPKNKGGRPRRKD